MKKKLFFPLFLLVINTIQVCPQLMKQFAATNTGINTTSKQSHQNITEESKKVFIHYMGWFGDGISGKHWENGQSRIPLIGYYSSQSWATLMYHILLSSSCGIDGLIINVKDSYDENSLKLLISTIKKIRNIDSVNFKYEFSISYDDQGMTNIDTAVKKFTFLRDSILPYAQSYLKYNDIPVICIWNYKEIENPYLSASEYNTALNSVFSANKPKVLWNEIEANGIANSYYPWVKGFTQDGSNWGQAYLKWYYDTLPITTGLDFATGGVWAGFNDTLCSWGQNRWIDRQNGAIYDSTWSRVNYYSASYPSSSFLPLKWVYIETWNDWNEGSEIEPSKEFGYQYLKLTVSNINTFKGTNISLDTTKFEAAKKIYQTSRRIELKQCDSVMYYPVLKRAVEFFLLNNYTESITTADSILINMQYSPGWPTLQHDAQHTGRSPFTGPQNPGLKWQFQLEGYAVGAPVIGSDSIIYLPSGYLNHDTTGYLYAIYPDGTQKWRFVLDGPPSYTSPAIADDGTIYIHSQSKYNLAGPEYLYAINKNGTLKWKGEFGTAFSSDILSSPVIGSDGTIYFGSANTLFYAINQDGSIKWTRQDINISSIKSSPTIAIDGTIYIVGPFRLHAFSPQGLLLWNLLLDNSSASSDASPCIANDGTIYIGKDHELLAVNNDGTLKWKYQTGDKPWMIISTPSISIDSTIYFGDNSGLYAINSDGSFKWKFKISPFCGSPVIGGDGTIYCRNFTSFYAVNPNGTEKWRLACNSQAVNPLSGTAIGQDGTLYITANGYLKAYVEQPIITSITDGISCGEGTIKLAATASEGTINWYFASTGGASLGTGSEFITPNLSESTVFYVDATNNGCTTALRKAVKATIKSKPLAPTIGVIIHPTCTLATGSVTLNDLPATGDWTINLGDVVGTGTSIIIAGLSTGTYSYTVSNSLGCASAASVEAVINVQPVTPSPPLVGEIIQPTCTTSIGSVALSGLPSGSWTLNPGTITGQTEVTTIYDLSTGTYNYTVTNASGCTSVASDSVIINEQPLKCPINIGNIKTFEVSAFPNPVTGFLNIEFLNENFNSINVLNAQGILILKEKVNLQRQQLDFSNYKSGLYILEFVKKSGDITRIKVVNYE